MSNRRIRVLIVDGSAVVRRLVTEALSSEPDLEVVGTAIDPIAARDKIVALRPDVVTVDIEMPRMDGLTFLRIIMEERPMPVIVVSSLTQAGSQHALEALRLGAVDVVGKPDESEAIIDLGPELREKIRAAATARIHGRPTRARMEGADAPPVPTTFTPALRALASPRLHHPRRLIALGASTGGTEALREVLQKLPGDLPPIAIVQHIPAVFSRAFAQRLDAQCSLEVREAVDGDKFVPGLALVAPGDYHLMVQWSGGAYRARILESPPVSHQRPSLDLLFRSIADCAGPHAIAGVLTGMGRDGADGLRRLRDRGALTFCQDEATSVVYGMPRAAWEAGGAQQQVPLSEIAAHLVTLTETPVPAHAYSPAAPLPPLSQHVHG